MRSLGALVFCVLAATAARADDPKPWAAGVSDAEQAKALDIYRKGNAEFEESRYAQALALYRDAIKHWDHPAIRFNMAVCLVNLDQPLEAYEALEHALAFHDAPLGADAYAQGLTYKKLLLGQLGHLRVDCKTPGAAATLDGQPIACPGETTKLLLPGAHQIVASKSGFVTATTPVVLLPGKEMEQSVELEPLRIKTHTERRWSASAPWILVGAGAGAALIGGAIDVLSHSEYQTYDQLVAVQCPSGCGPQMPVGMQKVAASTESHRSNADIEKVVGLSLLGVGGAVAIAGLVGVYLNQPRPVIDTAPTVAPMIGAGGAGATATWCW